MNRHPAFLLLCLALACALCAAEGMPTIYCTDLFHPHDDLDDHFDLACLYALEELDLKGIVLDQGLKQREKPGSIPIQQLNSLTGRDIPYATGLSEPLKTPKDTGEDQPEEHQQGLRLILSILRESPTPVTIIAVGSLRDVAAAYNRAPELFKEKADKLLLFIGDAQGSFQEYNVGLDVNAYAAVMNAPLPLYWVPCFDGGLWKNDGNASFWQAPHEALLDGASNPVLNFFLYAMLHKTAADPLAALRETPDPEELSRALTETRNLWCCAVFPFVAGRTYVRRGDDCLALPPNEVAADDLPLELFSFLPVALNVDEQGKESYAERKEAPPVYRFRIHDPEGYAETMTLTARALLRELSRMEHSGRSE